SRMRDSTISRTLIPLAAKCSRKACDMPAEGLEMITAPEFGPEPVEVLIMPITSRMRMASRTEARDIPCRSASARSPGSWSPTESFSLRRSSSIAWRTIWYARGAGFIDIGSILAGQGYGSIQDSTGVDCRYTKQHSTSNMPTDQPATFLRITDSWPSIFTEVAAMARFCGEISLPTTPPEVLAATSRFGSMPALMPAVCCSLANSALAEVSEPVTAVPIQPRIGDRKAKNAPVPASQVPMVMVWPERFITYARPRTERMVRAAKRML